MEPVVIISIILGSLVVALFLMLLLFHRKMFGKRWEPDGIIKYYDSSMFKGLNKKSVCFKMGKNNLRGFIYSYELDTYQGILVFSHGMWGSHIAYVQEIERLCKAGFKVLGFDYYGTELSDGKNIKGFGSSLKCLDYAIRYVKANYDEKIYVMGHSWGGFASANIAKYHPDLSAVVVMSGFVSVRSIVMGVLPKILAPISYLFVFIDSLFCGKYSFVNSLKVLNKSKIPTFIIHSRDDFLVKYELNTHKLERKIVNNNVKYLILDDKKHNPDYSMEALEYAVLVNKELNNLPNEQKLEYRKNIDYAKLGKLDDEIIKQITDFLVNY